GAISPDRIIADQRYKHLSKLRLAPTETKSARHKTHPNVKENGSCISKWNKSMSGPRRFRTRQAPSHHCSRGCKKRAPTFSSSLRDDPRIGRGKGSCSSVRFWTSRKRSPPTVWASM